MMALERQRRIVELVNDRGSIRVAEISRVFDVTPETVRRDLDLLEEEGKLLRSHGGAVRIEEDPGDIPYLVREETNSEEKIEVAKSALEFVNPGDSITLDASTTAWYLARVLPDMPLRVLTNSIRVVQELSTKAKVEVIATGGILRATSMSFIGPLAEETIGKYHVNKAFISCKGVHLDYGVSDSNELQAMIKQRMSMIADQVYLLVDHSKFGVRDFAKVMDVNDLETIITDSRVDQETIKPFKDINVKIYFAHNQHDPMAEFFSST